MKTIRYNGAIYRQSAASIDFPKFKKLVEQAVAAADKERSKIAKEMGEEQLASLVMHAIRRIEKTGKSVPMESADAVAIVESPTERYLPFTHVSTRVFLLENSYSRGVSSTGLMGKTYGPGIYVPKDWPYVRWDQLKKVPDLTKFIVAKFTKQPKSDEDVSPDED